MWTIIGSVLETLVEAAATIWSFRRGEPTEDALPPGPTPLPGARVVAGGARVPRPLVPLASKAPEPAVPTVGDAPKRLR